MTRREAYRRGYSRGLDTFNDCAAINKAFDGSLCADCRAFVDSTAPGQHRTSFDAGVAAGIAAGVKARLAGGAK